MIKIAMCQNKVFPAKKDTLANIADWVQKAATQGTKLMLLGECCNSFYVKKHLHENAEDFQHSETLGLLSQLSTKYGMYIAGSIPQKEAGKFYNSGFLLGPAQGLVLHYRKIHLFDVELPTTTYKESDMFSPGNNIKVADLGFCKFGMGVCYDIRFPQLAVKMAMMGADLLFYPSLFAMPTGPVYFQHLIKARAIDTLSFCAGVSSARVDSQQYPGIYQTWGNSQIVNPDGSSIDRMGHTEGIRVVQVDFEKSRQLKQNIPVLKQRRTDLY